MILKVAKHYAEHTIPERLSADKARALAVDLQKILHDVLRIAENMQGWGYSHPNYPKATLEHRRKIGARRSKLIREGKK